MAYLEDSPEAAGDAEARLGEEVGEEVEAFAKYLDECMLPRGTVAEQRARIFQLVDHYYHYARDTGEVLHERLRLERLARRGDEEDEEDGNGGNGGNGGSGMDLDGRPDAADAAEPASERAAAAAAKRWDEEAQTWDLLRRLLPLRYRDTATTTTTTMTGTEAKGRRDSSGALPQTRREYWADFVLSEPKARERKTVLEWLQSSARRSRPDVDDVVRAQQPGETAAHGWLHTRGAIKQHKRLLASGGDALDPAAPDVAGSGLDAPVRLVTQLDPDVVTRQGPAGRRLAAPDAAFEQAVWLGCYELLRRGSGAATIRDWCVERAEVWRAAAMSALPLASEDDEDDEDADGDTNDDTNDDTDDAPLDGLALVLWRRMCYRLAHEPSAGPHERAVHGVLAGDLASVEAVAASWDDVVFARYNAELRAQFDAYLVRQADPAAAHALLLLHGDVPVGGDRSDRMDRMDRMDRVDRARRLAVDSPAKALQAAVLDEKLDSFLFQQGVLLAAYANADASRPSRLVPQYDTTARVSTAGADALKFIAPTDCHGLRVLAHVLIVVSALDRLDGRGKDAAALGPLARRHQTAEHAIASYVSLLRLARLEELVPLYAAKLLGDRCYANMALNLIHVDDRETQVRLLHLMRRLGLDAVRFVRTLPQLFLPDETSTTSTAEGSPSTSSTSSTSFDILQPGPPTLKFGRLIRPGIFGPVSDGPEDDAEDVITVDKSDELLIRSMEWMMLVDGLVLEICDFGVRIYKHFLQNDRLKAARVLATRVPCAEIVRQKTRFGLELPDEPDPTWWEDIFGAASRVAVDGDALMADEPSAAASNGRTAANAANGGRRPAAATAVGLPDDVSRPEVAAHARPLYELECLVNALDCLETTAVVANMMATAHAHRDIAGTIDNNAKFLRGFMKPLLKDWLLHSVDDDAECTRLRETYLPQVVIGYASTLQFAGTTSSRDYLLECMELAAVVAAPGSDVAQVLVVTGRMKELVESFASCSKALAIWTSDMKKGPGASSKKMREMGWSRELWSVKP